MPELPEVETVCRGIAKALVGRTITGVQQNRSSLRIPFPAELRNIARRKVLSVERRAKYILLHLDDRRTLIIHLGMSGRLMLQTRKEKHAVGKHDHLVLTVNDGTRVVFNDARRFGLVDLARTQDLKQHRLFRLLGPEPFDKTFNAQYLMQKLKEKKTAIKLAIMDQRIVAGIGNIYAAEALFAARLNPLRPAQSLKPEETRRLITGIRQVLGAAIRAGGSSLRDYVQADGELGYFQLQWFVYGKENQKCRKCDCNIRKTGGIRRITQGGRSTFYCPVRQG